VAPASFSKPARDFAGAKGKIRVIDGDVFL